MRPTIHNPILRGFNPDPTILRVEDDYFIATSTFEYHPAVRLHHSTDLHEWHVIGHALSDGFDLTGVPDSGGVWAPSLTFVDGKFWLAYSIVRSMDGDDLDVDNYLVISTSIHGPWSEPIHLGSRGFDFSFFHDIDGTHWIVGVQWDQRPESPSFAGIVLEQYLPDEERTSGEAVRIYRDDVLVEGPNLYQVNGWYYLLLAEGGTGWNHGITVARSRTRTGPYERDHQGAILTSRDAPGRALQKAGHGELVQDHDGDWWLVHLASRPTLHEGERFSTLGRETCLQRVSFDTGEWLRLQGGGHHPELLVPPSTESSETIPTVLVAENFSDQFDSLALDSRHWSTVRTPLPPATADLASRPGWLRLRGGHSPASVFNQSMVLNPLREHEAQVQVRIDADPHSPREMAGLVFWYDRNGWIWLQLTYDEENGRHLRVTRRDGATSRTSAIPVTADSLLLRADVSGPLVRFSVDAVDIPGHFPVWTLSDDHGGALRFTGLHVGLRVDDLDGRGWSADFTDFAVRYDTTRGARGREACT